jgi:hypothetical protein
MAMELKFLGYQTIGDHTEFALQVRVRSNSGVFVVLTLWNKQVSCKGAVWSISRRFNDFSDLHSSLRLKKSKADLPAKQWFGRCAARKRLRQRVANVANSFVDLRQIF